MRSAVLLMGLWRRRRNHIGVAKVGTRPLQEIAQAGQDGGEFELLVLHVGNRVLEGGDFGPELGL